MRYINALVIFFLFIATITSALPLVKITARTILAARDDQELVPRNPPVKTLLRSAARLLGTHIRASRPRAGQVGQRPLLHSHLSTHPGGFPGSHSSPPHPQAHEKTPLTAEHKLGPEKHVLIKEAQGKGHKISPAEVVNIWKTKHPIPGVKSDILFLEKGNKHSGLAHIVDKHSKEFLQKGVKESDIPHLIEKATTTGGPVGMQVTKKNPDGRPIFKTEHGGQEMHVASTIGSNGYVVGMNVAKDPTKTGKK